MFTYKPASCKPCPIHDFSEDFKIKSFFHPKIGKIRTWYRPRDWLLTHIFSTPNFLCNHVSNHSVINSHSIDSTGPNPLSYLLTDACLLLAKLIAASRFQGSSEKSSVSPEKN